MIRSINRVVALAFICLCLTFSANAYSQTVSPSQVSNIITKQELPATINETKAAISAVELKLNTSTLSSGERNSNIQYHDQLETHLKNLLKSSGSSASISGGTSGGSAGMQVESRDGGFVALASTTPEVAQMTKNFELPDNVAETKAAIAEVEGKLNSPRLTAGTRAENSKYHKDLQTHLRNLMKGGGGVAGVTGGASSEGGEAMQVESQTYEKKGFFDKIKEAVGLGSQEEEVIEPRMATCEDNPYLPGCQEHVTPAKPPVEKSCEEDGSQEKCRMIHKKQPDTDDEFLCEYEIPEKQREILERIAEIKQELTTTNVQGEKKECLEEELAALEALVESGSGAGGETGGGGTGGEGGGAGGGSTDGGEITITTDDEEEDELEEPGVLTCEQDNSQDKCRDECKPSDWKTDTEEYDSAVTCYCAKEENKDEKICEKSCDEDANQDKCRDECKPSDWKTDTEEYDSAVTCYCAKEENKDEKICEKSCDEDANQDKCRDDDEMDEEFTCPDDNDLRKYVIDSYDKYMSENSFIDESNVFGVSSLQALQAMPNQSTTRQHIDTDFLNSIEKERKAIDWALSEAKDDVDLSLCIYGLRDDLPSCEKIITCSSSSDDKNKKACDYEFCNNHELDEERFNATIAAINGLTRTLNVEIANKRQSAASIIDKTEKNQARYEAAKCMEDQRAEYQARKTKAEEIAQTCELEYVESEAEEMCSIENQAKSCQNCILCNYPQLNNCVYEVKSNSSDSVKKACIEMVFDSYTCGNTDGKQFVYRTRDQDNVTRVTCDEDFEKFNEAKKVKYRAYQALGNPASPIWKEIELMLLEQQKDKCDDLVRANRPEGAEHISCNIRGTAVTGSGLHNVNSYQSHSFSNGLMR